MSRKLVVVSVVSVVAMTSGLLAALPPVSSQDIVAATPDAGGPARWKNAVGLASERLNNPFEALKPLYELKRAPGPTDWLSVHEEGSQTFAEFVKTAQERPRPGRNVVCVQPLGELKPGQEKIVELTADAIERFFGLPVRIEKPIGAAAFPRSARRVHWGIRQLHTETAVKLLKRHRPPDAFIYVAFTGEDLYPEERWNFVFGEAFPDDRIGIWSLARYGDPDGSPEEFRLSCNVSGSSARAA